MKDDIKKIMKDDIKQVVEQSLGDVSRTRLYFEYTSSKKLLGLQQEILKKVECKDCGWCCSSCNALLTEEDIEKLCKHLNINFEEFYDKYMDKDTIMNYLSFPCPFLDKSKEKNKCLVYDVRPTVCRLFPFNTSLLVIEPCHIGKNIVQLIDERLAEDILSKEDLEKKLENDKKKIGDTMSIYDELDAFLPQFNKVEGHLAAVIDQDLLVKILKELKKG